LEKKEKVETINRKDQKRFEAEQRQQKHNATKDLVKEISHWEIKISSYENLINGFESKLADPGIYIDGDAAKDISNRFNKTKSELELANKKWEELTEKLLEIESQFK